MGDQENINSSFTTDDNQVMRMLTALQSMITDVSERLLAQEDQITNIRNRQSILDYEGSPITPERKHSSNEILDRRNSLAERDLAKLSISNTDNRVLHTSQNFHMKQKLGDFLKFTEYLELVQEIKRFKSRPGNSAVDIYLYREEFMNSTMRSWVLTRLHLYYGSERAKRTKEYKSVTSSELTNLESVQFLPMLEKVFISTNKEEYQRFFKRIIEQFKPSMACKTLTMASVRYLIADFEVFTEIFTDAITVNPEKEKPDDTELGPWHPGLKDSKALDQQGMLPIIMSWFPVGLFRAIRSRMTAEHKIQSMAEWIAKFKIVLQDFSFMEARYHDLLSTISQTNQKYGSQPQDKAKTPSIPSKPAVYLRNITDNMEQEDEVQIETEDIETILSPLTEATDVEDDSTQPLNAITSGRPIPKKDDARRLVATGENRKPTKDLVCFRFLQQTCTNSECGFSHKTEDILKYLDETRRHFSP